MSVKLLDNAGFYGYRVRRIVNGKQYQEYFSLKCEGARLQGLTQIAVEQAALRRDAELAQLQEKMRKQLKADRCFKNDGSIRGVKYLLITKKNGMVSPVFQLTIASKLERRFFCTTISVNAHGCEEAWRKAIDIYAKHKVVAKNTNLFRRLLNAKSRYVPNDLNKALH